ncbi:MAG: divalent-cation tolerance protein CutA [Dehalococcoidia bacterium]
MGETTGYAVVLVTASGAEEGNKITSLILEKRLAACVNIVPKISSLFWWQGKIDAADEVLLIIKTRTSRVKAIVDAVKSVHSYTVPEVIALPIVAGNEGYLDWIDGEVGG